jgi:hypothetical protein
MTTKKPRSKKLVPIFSSTAPVVARVCSYGGGLDSWAMLLDAERRGDLPDVAVFIDVGDGASDRDGQDPGEWPGTYKHVREVAMPWCAARGVEFVWLSSDDYPVRDARSLFAWLAARKQIPVSGNKRICTTIAKVERFEAWLADRYGAQPVEVWIGFEKGEEKRADKDPNAGTKKKGRPSQRRNRFPLIESGLCRCRCLELARASGYPVPRKSACTFCPYGSRKDWKVFANELPEVFAQVVELEESKPPTRKNNIKLSIMGFSSRKRKDGTQVRKATPLPMYVAAPGKPAKAKPCAVCGAAERATKATGCDYLEGGE